MAHTRAHALEVTSPVPAVFAAELDSARRLALAEKSPATKRAYQSDFASFTAWCDARGLDKMPAAAETLAGYLASEMAAGLKVSTITRRFAAVGYAHRLGGFPSPTEHEAVRAVLRGIRRTVGSAPTKKAPATSDRINAMLTSIPTDTLRGKRDRALLLLGFAGAFRRSELVALDMTDLAFEAEGVRVRFRRSKTDQEGHGQEIAIPRGKAMRPVATLQDWIKAAGITSGPVFRSVNRHGQASTAPLTAQAVALIVKQYAEAAGLDPACLAGHSLRSGFLTSAADAGADVLRMMEVSRHRRVETVQSYIKRANLFQKHAGEAFL